MGENPVQYDANNSKGGSKSGIIIVLLIILIIVIAAVGVVLFFVLRKSSGNSEALRETREEVRNSVINSDNIDFVLDQMSEDLVEPGYYTVTQNFEWRFPAGDQPSTNAYVENVENNNNDVYFDLFIKGQEDNAIYESPIIPRGKHLDGFKLNTDLDPGKYDCVVVYHMIDENQTTIDTVRMAVTILIES